MKQKTCAVQDSYDAVKFLEEVKESRDYQTANSVLVNIFTERTQKDYIFYISGIVKEKLGKAKVSGLTCLSGFAQGERFHETTILTVLFFYKSEVDVLEYDFSNKSVDDLKDNFLSTIKNFSDLKGIQVFTTPRKNIVTNYFLSAISNEYDEIPIFGAGAGFDSGSGGQNLYVFGNEIYENGVVITLFRGENLRIYAESTLGWTPIGKEFLVTDVQDNHILKSLDNEVAGEIYKKYLGVVSSEKFIENTCEFPFMIRRGRKWVARMPVKKDEDGSIDFTADIHKGEKLMFSYGSKQLILQRSFNLAEYMSRKNLEGLLIHVCKNRQMYLKDAEMLELQAFSNFYRETAGCFAFSEILYRNKSGGLLNSALVAVGFREIDSNEVEQYTEDCFLEDVFSENNKFMDINKWEAGVSQNGRDTMPLPFEERLVNFLHATSRDLYLANLRLEEAATTDGLTRIFNRKKICMLIDSEIKKDRKEKFCLIMFDIDNFKHINDTYGHDMGDEVLVKISQTAKNCIRRQDSIGRWGGEEFMILLSATKKEEATEIAEKIRKSIYEIKWEKINQISVSVGVAEVRDDEELQDLYKRVDNRLYYSKTHGKNQVTFGDNKNV